jgi:exopolyphosphatase/guanosine-5'-triphosphate,3'-diphosphate pyrophosphatase
MEARYHVDDLQATRVESTVSQFLERVKDAWSLTDPLAELVLRWGARLHEIGLDISHSHYHKHSAYLLANADLPGFPRDEQKLLAAVVGGHRRKLNLSPLDDLFPPWHVAGEYLIVLLRLAVLLHRGRSSSTLPEIRLEARNRGLDVAFPEGWLECHPLTRADLDAEADYLKSSGFRIRLV